MTKFKERKLNKKTNHLPEGWIETSLGEVVETNSDTIKKDYSFKSILYLDTGSITKGDIEELKEIELSEAPSRAKRLVKNFDIVYSTVRPNQEHYGFIENPKENLVVSTGFTIVSANQKTAYPKFLYYFLTQKKITQKMQQIAEHSVSTYPSIKPENLESLKINLPPLPQQKAIAGMLSSFDDKIELLREQNETLEKIGQEIFKEWFGKYSVDKPDDLPDGWRVGKIGDIVNIQQGKYVKADKISENKNETNKYPIYGANGIRGYIKNFMYKESQVVFGCRGLCGFPKYSEEKSSISNTCMAFKTKNSKLSTEYIYFWSKRINFESVTSGSAQPQITVTNLYGLEIIVPIDEILEEFNQAVKPLFEKIKNNSEQIQTLSKTRDVLLPKLMRGEIILINFNK